jgi:hypothetical protein
MRLRVTLAAGFALALALVLATTVLAASLSGTFSGTEKAENGLGGSHKISATIKHGKVVKLTVSAGKVFCHIANESGPGSGSETVEGPGKLSGFPVFKVFVEQSRVVNGSKTSIETFDDLNETFASSRTNGGWKSYHNIVFEPGPIYLGISVEGSGASPKTLYGGSDAFQILYQASSSGKPLKTGPDSCEAEGRLNLSR